MNFEKFFSQDLNYIKENLNVNILTQKDDHVKILHYFFYLVRDLEIIKYVLDFTKHNCPSLFLERNIYGRTILHCLFDSRQDAEIIEYVLDFAKINYPIMFQEFSYSK